MGKIKRTQEKNEYVPHGRDLFQTPNYAVDLLMPFIPYGTKLIWEPAAGEGHLANRLEQHGYEVYRSDIRLPEVNKIRNFFDGVPWDVTICVDAVIVTNPPFSLKREFYQACYNYGFPFALLIPADYCRWIINALIGGAEKIIPSRRIDFITPTGLSGKTGNTANFHSLWLTYGFGLGKTETFVDLSTEEKENI